MKAFLWAGTLALFIAPAPATGIEEDDEAAVQTESRTRTEPRRQIVRRLEAVPAPRPAPIGTRETRPLPPAAPALQGIWVSRSHQRSPTA